jgi:poly-gamma-glutamate capsule biosynthesis protein CapA/YwtB (metallophosphatase superfamily)
MKRLARRKFLSVSAMTALGVLAGPRGAAPEAWAPKPARTDPQGGAGAVTLFVCGDVMTGRGIDQVLPHPSDPLLHEPYVRSALDYVELATRAHGPIPRPVDFAYPWGDALAELVRAAPEVRIVNLETAVTRSDDRLPKGINYRMHPANVPVLEVAGIDVCVLANNHVLDWGASGLVETLETLRSASITTVGAGRHAAEAAVPAILELPGGRRVVTFALGSVTSGIPQDWAASAKRPGVNLLEKKALREIAASIEHVKRPGDVVVGSLHWGENWGYGIPRQQHELAHALVDEAGVDIVHGHSSHHPKGIEVHGGRPILYGCGDFLNDYEGISGYEAFRGDLVLMYFVSFDPFAGKLVRLEMTPLQIRRFRLHRAPMEDARWLRDTLQRECAKLGTHVKPAPDGRLALGWA